jgi:hypothetical protein
MGKSRSYCTIAQVPITKDCIALRLSRQSSALGDDDTDPRSIAQTSEAADTQSADDSRGEQHGKRRRRTPGDYRNGPKPPVELQTRRANTYRTETRTISWRVPSVNIGVASFVVKFAAAHHNAVGYICE